VRRTPTISIYDDDVWTAIKRQGTLWRL